MKSSESPTCIADPLEMKPQIAYESANSLICYLREADANLLN
jgi:hypothetical protein